MVYHNPLQKPIHTDSTRARSDQWYMWILIRILYTSNGHKQKKTIQTNRLQMYTTSRIYGLYTRDDISVFSCTFPKSPHSTPDFHALHRNHRGPNVHLGRGKNVRSRICWCAEWLGLRQVETVVLTPKGPKHVGLSLLYCRIFLEPVRSLSSEAPCRHCVGEQSGHRPPVRVQRDNVQLFLSKNIVVQSLWYTYP